MDQISQLFLEINSRKQSIPVPDFVSNELVDTYQTCRVLDQYFEKYFQDKHQQLSELEINKIIDGILENFREEVMNALRQQRINFRKTSKTKRSKFQNIFQFAQCENLYLSNKYVNLISENMGHKLEEIANISNQVLIPEKTLKIKIKGIDLIIFDQGLIRYTQLKTKKDTLTGSQASRSINELRIHRNSIFAAALNMGNSWTISYKKAQDLGIELKAGDDFWSLIGLDYQTILTKLANVSKKIDRELY
jgi:hypothetical protein